MYTHASAIYFHNYTLHFTFTFPSFSASPTFNTNKMATQGGDSPVSALVDGLSVEKLVELVRVAETAERYEDMCKVFV